MYLITGVARILMVAPSRRKIMKFSFHNVQHLLWADIHQVLLKQFSLVAEFLNKKFLSNISFKVGSIGLGFWVPNK